MLLLTLRGTPTMYYGDELGMMQCAHSARSRAGPFREERAGPGTWPRSVPHAHAVGRLAARGIQRSEPWLPCRDDYRGRQCAGGRMRIHFLSDPLPAPARLAPHRTRRSSVGTYEPVVADRRPARLYPAQPADERLADCIESRSKPCDAAPWSRSALTGPYAAVHPSGSERRAHRAQQLALRANEGVIVAPGRDGSPS